jgi:hypothetical protein
MPILKLESTIKIDFTEVKMEFTRFCELYNPIHLQHTVKKTILALREAVVVQSLPTGRKPVV